MRKKHATGRWSLIVGLMLAALIALPVLTHAAAITLEDSGSSFVFDPTSTAGATQWTVNGVNQLNQQWYWYRVNNAPATGKLSVSGLSASTPNLSDAFPDDPANDTADFTYTAAGAHPFTMSMTIMLQGATDSAAITEFISIQNTGGSTLNLDLFQYNNYDLNATAAGDRVDITGSPANTAKQTKGAIVFSEHAGADTTPSPDHYQADDPTNLLAFLGNGSTTDHLNDTASYPANPLLTGDAAWGFEWNLSIAPGDSVLISKNRDIMVPEPATLFGLGIGSLLLMVRPSRSKKSGKIAA